MDANGPTERLVPLPQMARVLRVSQRWLREEADAGRIPCIRAERQYLFHPTLTLQSLVERLVAEGKLQRGEEKR